MEISYTSQFSEIANSAIVGIPCFILAKGVDRVARSLLAPNAIKANIPLSQSMISAFAEEAIYSGLLLTNSKMALLPRFLAAFFLSTTSARALTGKVEDQTKLSLDTKIGFLWAALRETLLLSLPERFSTPLLILNDSVVFALAEVTPLEIGTRSYKLTSAFFFRAVANSSAQSYGFPASLTQHLLFNLSA